VVQKVTTLPDFGQLTIPLCWTPHPTLTCLLAFAYLLTYLLREGGERAAALAPPRERHALRRALRAARPSPPPSRRGRQRADGRAVQALRALPLLHGLQRLEPGARVRRDTGGGRAAEACGWADAGNGRRRKPRFISGARFARRRRSGSRAQGDAAKLRTWLSLRPVTYHYTVVTVTVTVTGDVTEPTTIDDIHSRSDPAPLTL